MLCMFQKDCIKSACVHMQAPPPSRAAGRVTSANHLSLARAHLLHRSSLFVLSFIFCFYISVYISKVALATQIASCLEQSSLLWENGLTWSLEEEFTSGVFFLGGTISELKNGIIDSLCWGVRARFFINPPSLLTATRRVLNAAIPRRTVERSRYKALICVSVQIWTNANTWKCPLSDFGHSCV